MCAAYRGHAKIVEQCIKHGASVETTDSGGRNAIVYAIKGGNETIMSYLIDIMEETRKQRLPLPSLLLLIHFAALEGQLSCLQTLLGHASITEIDDFDYLWDFWQLPCAGQVEQTVSIHSTPSVKVSPLITVLLGQKVLPASKMYFRSLPFPPFRNYSFPSKEPNTFLFSEAEIKQGESPLSPPENTLYALGISPFVEMNFEAKCLKWRSRKIEQLSNGECELEFSPAMCGCFCVILNFIFRHAQHTGNTRLLEQIISALLFVVEALGMSRKRHAKSLTGMFIRIGALTRARPSPISSCPEFILQRAGVCILDETNHPLSEPMDVAKFVFSQPLFSHELQKVSRHIFLPISWIVKFVSQMTNAIEACQFSNVAETSFITGLQQFVRITFLEFYLKLEISRRKVASDYERSLPVESDMTDLCIDLLQEAAAVFGVDVWFEPLEAEFQFAPISMPLMQTLFNLNLQKHRSFSIFELIIMSSDHEILLYLIRLLKRARPIGYVKTLLTRNICIDPFSVACQQCSKIRLSNVYDWTAHGILDLRTFVEGLAKFKEHMSLSRLNALTLIIYFNDPQCCHIVHEELLPLFDRTEIGEELQCSVRSGRYSFGTSTTSLVPNIEWHWDVDDSESRRDRWRSWADEALGSNNFDNLLNIPLISMRECPQNVQSIHFVDSESDFQSFLSAMKSLRESARSDFYSTLLGVDLEFAVGSGVSSNITCLIQLAYLEHVFVLDPFKVYDQIVHNEEFLELFSSSALIKIFHSGHNDIRRLLEDFDICVQNVWDTSRVADLMIKRKSTAVESSRTMSLEALTAHYFPGIRLDKSLQKSEWRSRPLTPSMIAYAAMDALVICYIANQQAIEIQEIRDSEFAASLSRNHSKFLFIVVANSAKNLHAFPSAVHRRLGIS
eukprot:Gregarina_sp_Poly_1__9789@NODE_624_length_7087_cov_45_976353_g478_i0_p1_GENE_NODE_624_length_7087_cov_45_976353_g478_i0NODE_624_length_7087_cov_45_976353_g478_i0_p1_ORF_typecomplete_len901_score118_25DNA_pol_A_exo1/PF01612_20/1e04DNA_pol_A_exo1/PF01612_20/1_3e32Ank_2/PF12796_7/1_9e07Ank_2/PF12796_7/15Ank_2/PF12796_7/1_2e04Ank_4/PF13637_6/3_2e07Ank_4/PF13637_6/5_1Ank_5/PF13857_6/0_00015Ank_5/PF13857_6/0_024Ank_5/PF13857_6/68Ank_3/PF13606_6/0_11Ank_3/PF13606_6/11Ank_3/PF13606_6/4_1e02Ank/PF00023_3